MFCFCVVYIAIECGDGRPATFDWDVLTEEGLVAAGIGFDSIGDVDISIDTSDLSLDIVVRLPYFGNASADNQGEKWGVTYVLDFVLSLVV